MAQKAAEEKAKKEAEITNETNRLLKINNIIQIMLKNDKLITIIENFKILFDPWLWEFCFIPFSRESNNSEISYKIIYDITKYEVNDSEYLKLAKLYNNEFLSKEFFYADVAYNLFLSLEAYKNMKLGLIDETQLKNIRFLNRSRMGTFIKLDDLAILDKSYDLFILLNNQNVITDNSFDAFRAFIYVCYHIKKIRSKQYVDYILSEYNLKNSKIEKIIKKLYEVGYEKDRIKNEFSELYLNQCSEESLYNIVKYEWSEKVNDIEEKKTIKSLLEGNKNSSENYTVEDFDLMSGSQFEQSICSIFNKLGYNATLTKSSGDQGVDIIATKNMQKIAIQTKCYNKPVGNHAIMEVVAGAKHYKADQCIVVTNNYFTASAKILANDNNVYLWDRNTLKEKLKEIE